MVKFRRARRAFGLYGVARPAEWPAVTGFLLQTAIAGMLNRNGEACLRVQGGRFWLSYRSGETSALIEVLQGVYEKLPDFRPQKGWVVVDVGANVGAFTVRAARLGGRVFAFEPNPDCFRRLTKATRGLDVRCIELAAGGVPGQAHLSSGSGWTTMGSVAKEGDGMLVGVDRLESQLPPGLRVDLLKLDVEGGEVDVLQGAGSVLDRVQRVVFEFHSDELLSRCQVILDRASLRPAMIDRQPWPHARPGIGNAYFQRQPHP